MKLSAVLLCAALLAAAAPLAPAQQEDGAVPIDFFYDALSPYGDWVYTQNYGYVWQPLAAQQPGWAPYADGSWAFTDAGWTWISNEDFGWLTYHYGRWILMQQNWVWVPGNEWAPAWVSWRQTQGQIGWAPLPPEAAWSPGIGFGGWTDSYYDVGPAYYNFVPVGAFTSRTSLRPLILDRSRNFTFYDQSVNVTHTSYRPNVLHHIFVGGPDPQRFDGLGGNQVRRLTLRHDDESFRRDWLEGRSAGRPPGGTSNHFRIDHDQLIVAAPIIRREAAHGLPSRVRESLQQPVVDRGWRGAADAQSTDLLRQRQRDELARTRPPNLPEKTLRPATSDTPPPAFGRVLQPEERIGAGGFRQGDPGHANEALRPTTPGTTNGPPGIPGRKTEEPVSGGMAPLPGLPHREHRPEIQRPGMRPDENLVPAAEAKPQTKPGLPPGPQSGMPHHTEPPKRLEELVPTAPMRKVPYSPAASNPSNPNEPNRNSGFPGHQGQRPGHFPEQQPAAPPSRSVAPPHAEAAPMPPAQAQPPRIHPQQPPVNNAPPVKPVAIPPNAAPVNTAPQNPGPHGKKP